MAAARAAGVRDERLLAAMATLPRASFVPPEFASEAYLDVPVKISHLQVTTQPSLVAMMVEALQLHGDVFACGDVRFSPVKRVAAAVGEGSMAIAFVHQYLKEASLLDDTGEVAKRL